MIKFDVTKLKIELQTRKLSYRKFVKEMEEKTGIKVSWETIRLMIMGITTNPTTKTLYVLTKYFRDISDWYIEEE
uniref:Uncharacterized protein n=1 Tax=viral metagenome TaxID=1070528 RepID=A0A6H2A3E9_9ZZZZ